MPSRRAILKSKLTKSWWFMSLSRPTPFRPPSTDSPCVRNCCLDNDDICLGCGRSLEEIKGWGAYTDEERNQVLKLARKRRDRFPHWTP